LPNTAKARSASKCIKTLSLDRFGRAGVGADVKLHMPERWQCDEVAAIPRALAHQLVSSDRKGITQIQSVEHVLIKNSSNFFGHALGGYSAALRLSWKRARCRARCLLRFAWTIPAPRKEAVTNCLSGPRARENMLRQRSNQAAFFKIRRAIPFLIVHGRMPTTGERNDLSTPFCRRPHVHAVFRRLKAMTSPFMSPNIIIVLAGILLAGRKRTLRFESDRIDNFTRKISR